MNIRKVLEKMIASRASDLHLKAGTPPIVRVDGVLYTLDDPAPTAQQLRDVCNQLLNDEQRLYFSTSQRDRLRVRRLRPRALPRQHLHAAQHAGAWRCATFRSQVPSIEELMLPAVVRELAFSPRGLILVTGRTGAGKSTTLASMIDAINRDDHAQHHHDRGSDRVPPRRPPVVHPSARDRARHALVPRRS